MRVSLFIYWREREDPPRSRGRDESDPLDTLQRVYYTVKYETEESLPVSFLSR